MRAAADALADAGATVTEVNPGFLGNEEAEWNKLWEVFMATYYGEHVAEFGDQMTEDVLELIERGKAMSAVDYKQVEFTRTRMWNQIRPILGHNDVLLCPTMATGPVEAPITGRRSPSRTEGGRLHSPDMTAIWNMISPCPVMTVPCGLDGDALPIGAQLVGRRWRSDHLLAIAATLESALAPIGRPPI